MVESPQARNKLARGVTIGDTYVVERFLAGGGMGQVYVCRDAQLDRRVAVKLLHRDLEQSAEADARFQLEARVMSRVVHPNVVAVYAFGRHGDAWYIAMELVEGQGLDEVLREKGTLGLEDAVSITRQVASGLAEAHAHGIIHRDIKPGNVLLRRLASGAVLAKVVDFGIARVFDSPEPGASPRDGGKMLGTPAYMSPEQIQSHDVDGRADLYSLAVLAFQMLSGNLPIFRGSTQGTLIGHLVDDPADLAVPDLRRSTARSLQRVLHKGLAKKREERHTDVLEFASALEIASGLARPDSHAALVPCPACRQPSRGGGGFCDACGSSVPLVHCPACNTERHGERYFCADCGTSLLGPSRRAGQDVEERAETVATTDVQAVTAVVLVAQVDGVRGLIDASASAEFSSGFVSMVEREGGRPLAMLGTEALAVFGLGGMREGEMEAALDTALGLPRLLDRVSGGARGPALRVGVSFGSMTTRGLGVAWGTAMAGGDAVEAARDAARACGPGQVVATDAACREARGTYETEALAEGLQRILRHHDASQVMTAARAPDARTPLVGRGPQIGALLRVAAKVDAESRMQAVAIVGEAGSGKSRLAATVLGEMERQATSWQVDIARCSPIGFPVPFEPFVDILRMRSGSAENADRTAILDRLAGLLGVAEEGADDPLGARRLASLGRLMGLDANQTLRLEATRPASEVEQAGAFEAYTAYLRRAASQGALVMVLEDLQWAKPQTLELLDHVLKSCVDLPLLVLMLLRTERAGEVLGALKPPPGRVHTLQVPTLTAAQTRDVLKARVGGADVPDLLVQRLHEFSGGLPARLEEALDALADDGVLVKRGGRWQVDAGRAADTSLDRPLSDMVLRRIGRLPPADRSLLTALATAGNFAPLDLLSAMLDRKIRRAELHRVCQTGLAIEVKARHFQGQREFALRQQQVAEIVSHAVPSGLRKELHRRAAAWLMAWTGPRPPGFGAMLAHHFLVAGDDRRAAEFLVRTAQESMRAFATRDAFDTFAAAVEVARQAMRETGEEAARDPLIEALLGRAEVGLLIGDAESAQAAAIDAEELAEGDRPSMRLARARALIVQGEAATRAGDYEAALEAYGDATACATVGVQGTGLAAIATGRKALVLFRAGRHAEAEAFAHTSLDHYRDAVPTPDVLNGLGRLRVLLGHIASRRGDAELAREHYEAARSRYERGGDQVGVNVALLSLGNAAYRAGDLDTAGAMYRQSAEACHVIDYVQGVAMARTNLGNVLLDQGAFGAALRELYPAENAMRRTGSLDMLPETLRLIALCRMETGNLAGAVSAAREAVSLARTLGDAGMEKAAGDVLEEAEMRAGDPDQSKTRVDLEG